MVKFNPGNKYFLAPMHNVNDIAFRMLCKRAGAGICWTELTNPESKKPVDFSDKPAIQLVCNKTRGVKKFIKKHEKNAVLFDFNLGCPSPHAKQSRVGWYMREDYKTIDSILKEMKQSTKKPVTIKIRKMPLPVTRKIIKIAEKYCDAIAVHPRTCGQGYSGEPDIAYAKKVKKLTKLPIIYSGNITDKESADSALKEFDYVMIGRASLGNSSIFSELCENKVKKIILSDYLKLAKRYGIDFNQIKRHAMYFTKGVRNSRKIRNKLIYAKSVKEIISILHKYKV